MTESRIYGIKSRNVMLNQKLGNKNLKTLAYVIGSNQRHFQSHRENFLSFSGWEFKYQYINGSNIHFTSDAGK